MSFSLPERVTLKGPNFIREVFERGVGCLLYTSGYPCKPWWSIIC